MLSACIKDHLQQTTTEVLPQHQQANRQALLDVGCTEDRNSSFLEFMTKYGDDYDGSCGQIVDVAQDLQPIERSRAFAEWKHGLPRHFLPLTSGETDEFLLYDVSDDSVVLIENGSLMQLRAGDFDGKWSSFNEFLVDFFELA